VGGGRHHGAVGEKNLTYGAFAGNAPLFARKGLKVSPGPADQSGAGQLKRGRMTTGRGVEWGRYRAAGSIALPVPTIFRELMAIVAIAALVLGLLGPAAPSAPAAGLGTTARSSAQVIVRAVPDAVDSVARLVHHLGGTVGRRLGIIDGFSATVPASRLRELERAPGVAAVTPDGRGRFLGIDPLLGYDPLANLGSPASVASMVNAQPAYQAGITGKGVDVALIDTGVVPVNGLTVPGKVVNGADLSTDSQAPNLRYVDGYGHGTHMAGLIAGRDDGTSGSPRPGHFSGVAPDARILNVKVGASDGSVDVSQVIAAVDWVVEHRKDPGLNVQVLSLAFGTDATQSYTLDPLAYAVEVAWRKGIVVVVAGGNDGRSVNSLANPAIDPYVIAVGASDPMGTLSVADDSAASFSSKGNKTRHVDVVAPGKSIISLRDPGSYVDTTYPSARVGDRFFLGSGTSQAAAVTAGAAALLLQDRPNLTPDQVKDVLIRTARPIQPSILMAGNGLIDVGGAMAADATRTKQSHPYSTGDGSIDAARGSVRVVDPHTGKAISGEQDIMGKPWNGADWASKSWKGSSWSGGEWNGSSWSGSSWSGSSWSGSSWSACTWTGSSWSGSSWSSYTWSGSSWSGSSWSGSSWYGSSWSGSSWSGSSWSGSSWSSAAWG
jgi:serine protease AprX